ncbi:MAG: family lipase [Paenibacillaceae bacterium]|nr:family lipase [Paenibacillaceae bacterium]
MKSIMWDHSLFQGAVSLEQVAGGIKPWRIPYREYALFPPDGMGHTAHMAAGVRIRFASGTTNVTLELAPVEAVVRLDLVCGNEEPVTRQLEPGETIVTFRGLEKGEKVIEVYLPQNAPVIVKALYIDEGASWHIAEDCRAKWITYGSSITQCNGAFSPARTWPALVARRFGLHLTCLGYGGNCHLEPMVARMIRDLQADVISLCPGINIYGGGGSLTKRTFQAAVIGFVQIIRDKHPETPIVLMSPIWAPRCEETKNAVGFTLQEMRAEIGEAAAIMTALGDSHLHYVNGLAIFGASLAGHLPDQLHPNGQGYTLLGQNFGDTVMEQLVMQYGLTRKWN